jgi:hypothetical protein
MVGTVDYRWAITEALLNYVPVPTPSEQIGGQGRLTLSEGNVYWGMVGKTKMLTPPVLSPWNSSDDCWPL